MGRAIWHANDYAAIVSADFRYATMAWIASVVEERMWCAEPRGCRVRKSYEGGSFFLLREMSDFVFDKRKIVHGLSTVKECNFLPSPFFAVKYCIIFI